MRTVVLNRGKSTGLIFNYCKNRVYSTKYTLFNFLPKFLHEQFSRYANLFFLAIASIQQIPGITPVSRWGTIVPLSVILLVSAIKEVVEDWRRWEADERANNALCEVYDPSLESFQERRWADVQVGDLLRIVQGQEFPADMVLLKGSHPDGTCYVQTANIDGETSLKTREAVPLLSLPLTSLSSFQGIILCDEPNKHVFEFSGNLLVADRETPLGPTQMLLRGSTLQYTSWVVGAVIYTGRDTKIVRNSRTTPSKRSSLENMTNRQIVYLFIVLLSIVTFCFSVFCLITIFYTRKLAYLEGTLEMSFGLLVKKFLTFLVLLNNLVPISLVVSMEVIRIRLGRLIDLDVHMYCAESDTPASVRTSTLIEELGQINYLFSDKTGTLTKNEMILRRLYSAAEGIDYEFGGGTITAMQLQQSEEGKFLLLAMTLCHMAIVAEETVNGTAKTIYQSSSPDETAILWGIANVGSRVLSRTSTSIRVTFQSGSGEQALNVREFEILATLEFTSSRKRMCIVVKDETDRILLFSKGADAMIATLLQPDTESSKPGIEEISRRLSTDGLRTLCFAYREIPPEEFQAWYPLWQEAQSIIIANNKANALDQAMRHLERQMIFLGMTGVEDRLQEGVPETIEMLHRAGIKVWMLTGDKQETALNVGFSSGLLTLGTFLLQLGPQETAENDLQSLACQTPFLAQEHDSLGLIIESHILQVILEQEHLEKLFISLASHCHTVICCRTTPDQKAKVVEMIRTKTGAICLAIGDGANDVAMIQAAQVGVGISGKEGLQAARAADFSIAQFRFLQRLLLVHGSWGYHRISKAALFCIYKNVLLYACQFWFAFWNLFSGQTLFESWMLGLYNVLFTCMPPIVIGLTDQFVTAPFLLAHPELYRFGQESTFYNPKSFWQSILNGVWQSFLAFILTAVVMHGEIVLPNGKVTSLWYMGSTCFAGILLAVVLKAALLTNYWTAFAVVAFLFCPLAWFTYVSVYGLLARLWNYPSGFVELVGLMRPLFGSAAFWLIALLIPTVCLLRDFAWKFYQRQFLPTGYHIIQELQKGHAKKRSVQ